MGDRSTVNIITEIHDRMNIGVNVNLHWGGSNAQYDALETLRSYNYNRRCDEEDVPRLTTAVLHALYRTHNEPYNVYMMPFCLSHSKATKNSPGDTEHTVVTIDIPRHTVVLRNVGHKLLDMGYRHVREFSWTDIDAVEDALKDMDRIFHIEHYIL